MNNINYWLSSVKLYQGWQTPLYLWPCLVDFYGGIILLQTILCADRVKMSSTLTEFSKTVSKLTNLSFIYGHAWFISKVAQYFYKKYYILSSNSSFMAAFDRFLSRSEKKGHTVPVFSKSAPRAASEADWVEATVRPQTGSNEDRLAASPPWWMTAGTHQPNVGKNRRRELPLAGAATSIIFVTTKVVSRQTHACHNIFLSQQNFCCGKHLLRQT